MNAADGQIKGLVEVAASHQEGAQAAEMDPILIGNHHAEGAIGPRLQNDVRGGEQRAAGIGNDSAAANAGAGGAIVFGTEQRHRGAQRRRQRGRNRERLRKRRAAQEPT